MNLGRTPVLAFVAAITLGSCGNDVRTCDELEETLGLNVTDGPVSDDERYVMQINNGRFTLQFAMPPTFNADDMNAWEEQCWLTRFPENERNFHMLPRLAQEEWDRLRETQGASSAAAEGDPTLEN